MTDAMLILDMRIAFRGHSLDADRIKDLFKFTYCLECVFICSFHQMIIHVRATALPESRHIPSVAPLAASAQGGTGIAKVARGR